VKDMPYWMFKIIIITVRYLITKSVDSSDKIGIEQENGDTYKIEGRSLRGLFLEITIQYDRSYF